jgi:uncharacterized protein (TIGR02453 family)
MADRPFSGFPAEAIEFYEGLEADNSKAYWSEHKPTYDACVRAPMEALLAALEPEFGAGHVFRPYRDVRYSRDKSPYKTAQGGVVGHDDGSVHYVQLSADGLFVAGGVHSPARDQLERLRAAIDDEASARPLLAVLDDLRAAGYETSEPALKRAPRGYPVDHPRIGLLRCTELTAGRRFAPEGWMGTPAALDVVRGAWRALQPLNDWVGTHVGASHLPPDRPR